MPTYEYVCSQCQHEFEAFQSMKDAPLTTCPACQRPSVKRKVGSGAGLIFKGSGFYITDYKNKPANGAAGKEGKGADGGKGGETGGSKPSESAPAKTEAKPAPPAKT